MNLLLTGKPHVGKSTILADIVANIGVKQGFVTRELTMKGARTGFELVSASGDRSLLASTDSDSGVRVSKYGVEINNLRTFLKGLHMPHPGALLYIDEIGQMELFSEEFKQLVLQYLDAENAFIGTLTSVYKDSFIDQIKARDDIEIVEVTFDNRDVIQAELVKRITSHFH